MKGFTCKIPECESEHYAIEQFTISKIGASHYNLGLAMSGQGYHKVEPGTFTRLRHKKHYDPIMSDTRAELFDHSEFIQRATGHVLLNGLGLGCVLGACLERKEVTHITVIELEQEVINLVGPHFQSGNVTIICHDALTYKPPRGTRYGSVWHDIWPTICADNIPDMKLLHRKYGRRTDTQGSWCRWECERQR